MVAWVVIDRRHYRQAGPFALPLSTLLFPPPHLSPLLPYSYGHSYTTAPHQPLCNQSVTRSFRSGWFYGADRRFRPCRTGSPFLSQPCALFCVFLHFFAFPKNSTLFFSIVSALFAKNTRGWGTPHLSLRGRYENTNRQLRRSIRPAYPSGVSLAKRRGAIYPTGPEETKTHSMADLQPELIALGFIWYVAFLFSTTCHEAAHAMVAKIGGDDTASAGGQVSLNPVPHIQREPWGMVVIPILSLIATGNLFGWASERIGITTM